MIHEAAEDRTNQLDTPTDSKMNPKGHNKVLVMAHKAKEENLPSPLQHRKQDEKKKITKESKSNNKDESSKMNPDGDNANKVHQNTIDVGASYEPSDEENNVDDAGKGDMLEENLMKMDKRYFY